jgi:hypothetical protein
MRVLFIFDFLVSDVVVVLLLGLHLVMHTSLLLLLGIVGSVVLLGVGITTVSLNIARQLDL